MVGGEERFEGRLAGQDGRVCFRRQQWYFISLSQASALQVNVQLTYKNSIRCKTHACNAFPALYP